MASLPAMASAVSGGKIGRQVGAGVHSQMESHSLPNSNEKGQPTLVGRQDSWGLRQSMPDNR
ncbi:hypothetical protein ABIF21_004113 [Bradyrhizobium elkanii]